MSALDSIGRVFGVGVPGPELDPATEGFVRDLAPSSFVLFARNLRSASQTRDLVAGLREVSPSPVLVAIDQEGGRVSRLRAMAPDLDLATAATLGSGPPEHTRDAAEATGRVLASLDIDWNFAPVADLDTPGSPNGIADRSFGPDPAQTTDHAAAWLEGLHTAATLGCLKHFPGLGNTPLDTHESLAICPDTEKKLWTTHTLPYRQLAKTTEAIMIGHAAYPEITGDTTLPATLSTTIATDWLRTRLDFDGLAVSDDMEMHALPQSTPGKNAVAALAAGCDLLLFCSNPDKSRHARDEAATALESGDLPTTRIETALARLRSLFEKHADLRRTAPTPPAFDQALATLRETAAV